MQGIELVAIFSLLSSLFSLFSAPSSLLSSALDSRNRIPAFLQGIMRPRGLPPCRNAAIRDGPGANKPCCQSIWGSLAAFFVISSLFSLLASVAAARPGQVQTLLQLLLLLQLLDPAKCKPCLSSVVHYFLKAFTACLCALPSCLSEFDFFLFFRDCHFDLCIRPSMARHTASFHGDTPILIQTWFSHLNAYASTCALHPNEYPNLAGRWRSLSHSAIQSEVQLAGTCA